MPKSLDKSTEKCGSHADYQNFVVETLRKYYPAPDALARSTWDIIEHFWHLDLSDTDVLLADKYSKFGPAPRIPSCMQRSYLLSIEFKVSSITEWAAQLKINPLFAILSGFQVGDTPGVGTFYDFLKRLWDSDESHMSSHIHPMKTKVKKPDAKGEKAASVEKITVADLLPQLEKTSFSINDQTYASLFKIYRKEFLDVSVEKGLIHKNSLALAGDGTPVVTSHRERKKRICKCKENGISGCNCDRYFLSRTVTLDGIPLATAFIMDMIYICWSIHRVIFRYFPTIPVLQSMIRMDSFRLFSE